jgi:hypothetical protein
MKDLGNSGNGNPALRGIDAKFQDAPLRNLSFEAEEVRTAVNRELIVLGAVVYPVIQTPPCLKSVRQNNRRVDTLVQMTVILHDAVVFDWNGLQSALVERLVDLVPERKNVRRAKFLVHVGTHLSGLAPIV